MVDRLSYTFHQVTGIICTLVIAKLKTSGKSRYIWRKAHFPHSLVGFTQCIDSLKKNDILSTVLPIPHNYFSKFSFFHYSASVAGWIVHKSLC